MHAACFWHTQSRDDRKEARQNSVAKHRCEGEAQLRGANHVFVSQFLVVVGTLVRRLVGMM